MKLSNRQYSKAKVERHNCSLIGESYPMAHLYQTRTWVRSHLKQGFGLSLQALVLVSPL